MGTKKVQRFCLIVQLVENQHQYIEDRGGKQTGQDVRVPAGQNWHSGLWSMEETTWHSISAAYCMQVILIATYTHQHIMKAMVYVQVLLCFGCADTVCLQRKMDGMKIAMLP